MKTNLQTAMSFDLKVAPVSLPAREIAVRFSATVIQSRRDRQHFLDSGSGNGNRSRGISQHETNFGPAKGSAVRDVRSIHEMSSIVLKFGVACFPRFVQLFRKSHATEVSMKNLFSRIGSSVLMVFVLFFSPNVLRADVTGSILGTVHDSRWCGRCRYECANQFSPGIGFGCGRFLPPLGFAGWNLQGHRHRQRI
jgi:hypothetical protein